MIIKQIVPWKLKIGQLLLRGDRFNKIISIKKEIGRSTGKSIWLVETEGNNFLSMFHAKLNYLKVQKATIKID